MNSGNGGSGEMGGRSLPGTSAFSIPMDSEHSAGASLDRVFATQSAIRFGGRRARDAIFGVGVAIAACVFAIAVIPIGIVSPASVKHLALSPTFLPYALTILIGVLGLVCAAQALFAPGLPKDPGDGHFGLRDGWPISLALLIGAFCAYCLLTETLGLLIVSVLVTGGLMLLGGERRPMMLIGAALLLPTAIYLFFARVAQVPLPAGLLDGLI